MAIKPKSAKQSTNETSSDPAVSYNEFKEYEGQRYTGMKIGRSHKWHYDGGGLQGNESFAGLVADQLCGHEAARGPRARRIGCAGRH